jgi:hypothetical protein
MPRERARCTAGVIGLEHCERKQAEERREKRHTGKVERGKQTLLVAHRPGRVLPSCL